MLSDEERQAIKGLEWSQQQMRLGNLPDYDQGHYADVRIVLNLIEKQSKEIEELKEELNKKPIFLIKDLYNRKLKEISLQDTEGLIEQGKKEMLDKIKAKIEELEKLDFGTDLVSQFTANLTTITILQSLLEKE